MTYLLIVFLWFDKTKVEKVVTTLKPGRHIVGRIVSMRLRPCPKEHITAPRRRLQKSLVTDCYYQKHASPYEKTAS